MVPILFALALSGSAVPVAPHADAALLRSLHADRPGIRLWTTHDEVYRRGDRVRVYFRTERDAYVTILRADTDGRLRVLYPRDPWDENFVRGGATYAVNGAQRGNAFAVDDDPGVGYVFGIASSAPFMYDRIVSGDQWAIRAAFERIHGDPYNSLMDAVSGLMPEGYVDYDTHLLPYYVEQRYDFPRFVCYDCHSGVGFAAWNPYLYSCRGYSLFVYTDPYYFYPSYWYPTRYYGGTRVVYVRPSGVGRQGRYVFKDRRASDPPIVYRRRTADVASNTPADRGVRGVDIGGVGTVGVPGIPGRRTVGTGSPGPSQSPGARGESGGRRAVVDPGLNLPTEPGTGETGSNGRRGVGGDETRDQPDPRPGEPGLRPEERPQPNVLPARPPADPKAGETGRRTTPSQPSERPRAEPASRPRSDPEPRAEPARRPDPPPERRADPQPQRRPDPQPQRRADPPPQRRSEPRSAPAPQSRPASPPARSAPQPAPARRRPDR